MDPPGLLRVVWRLSSVLLGGWEVRKEGRGDVGGLWPSMVAMVPTPPLASCFAHGKIQKP